MSAVLFSLRLVLIVLLYAFLALMAWLIWRELKQASAATPSASAAPRGARLTVVASGDSGYAEGQQFPLQAVTTLGRDLSNDIVIADGYASSRHARIERRDNGRFWLIDVGSSNGTLLNGQSVRPNAPAALDPGDVIAIGKVEIKVG